jgi:hypothetical protein
MLWRFTKDIFKCGSFLIILSGCYAGLRLADFYISQKPRIIRIAELPQKCPGVNFWTREGRLGVSERPIVSRNFANGPDMDRSPKRKSDPGKVAPCKYWSG